MADNATQLRQELLILMKSNGVYVSGETWFTLVFMDEQRLMALCREAGIR